MCVHHPLPAMNAGAAYEFGLWKASHMDGGEQPAGFLQEGAPYSQGQLEVLWGITLILSLALKPVMEIPPTYINKF